MKSVGLFIVLLAVCSSKLVFEDNFTTFNMNTWRHDITLAGGGNWEFQLYDNNRSTTFVTNNTLHIRPLLTSNKIGEQAVRAGYTYDVWGGAPADYCTQNNFYGCSRTSDGNHYINPIMSGKVTTVNSFKLKYGRVEVKAKLPKGDWLWPAIWMLPVHNEYGEWPASGEIDIMESRGNVGYPQAFGGGPETIGSTLHWGSDYFTNQYVKTHKEYSLPGGKSFADDFHTFGLYWDNKTLYTYVDNDTNRVLVVDHSNTSYWERSGITDRENPWQYSKNKNAPFDTEFYLILNLAVGGTAGYFKDGVAGKPWSDTSQRASSEFYDNKGQWYNGWNANDSIFRISSVKVWDLLGEELEPVTI
jgi:beta-glucanase (GH16 family)